MKCIFYIIFFLFAIPGVNLQAQQTEENIRAGNDQYKKGNYSRAATEYLKVQTDPRARFNYGIALYRQQKTSDAAVVFDGMKGTPASHEILSDVYYNRGVIFSGQNKLEESIEAYKASLRLNPGHTQARENLQKALLELRKKTPPEKKDNPKKKENQPKKQQPKISPRLAEQKLKQLEQKEKEVQQRLQQKNQTGGVQPKDW